MIVLSQILALQLSKQACFLMLVLTAPSYNNDSINVNCCHVEPFDMLRAGSVKHLTAGTAHSMRAYDFDEMLHFAQHNTALRFNPLRRSAEPALRRPPSLSKGALKGSA